MREGGMRNVVERGRFHPLWESVGCHSSPGHIFLGIPLALCLLVDGGKFMRIDGRGTVAAHQSLPASTSTSTTNWKIHRCTLWDEKRKKQAFPVILMTRILDEWQPCLHRALLHCQWRTSIKDPHPPPPTQKSLKVTEWILIRSGVVNGSQHGLQWD